MAGEFWSCCVAFGAARGGFVERALGGFRQRSLGGLVLAGLAGGAASVTADRLASPLTWRSPLVSATRNFCDGEAPASQWHGRREPAMCLASQSGFSPPIFSTACCANDARSTIFSNFKLSSGRACGARSRARARLGRRGAAAARDAAAPARDVSRTRLAGTAAAASRSRSFWVRRKFFFNVPDHAAVDLAVRVAQTDRRAAPFAGLINAVLRRLTREGAARLAALDPSSLDAPDWLMARWIATYGDATARAIAAANSQEPALDVTVKSDPEFWAAKFGGRVLATGSVRLVAPGAVGALPGFAEGAWWVQDAAAALPARLGGDIRATASPIFAPRLAARPRS